MQRSFPIPGQAARFSALIARERRTRFTGGLLAPFWSVAVPMVWIGLVVGLFIMMDRRPPIAVGVEVFVATGILPYAMFRQTIGSMVRSLVAHRHMKLLAPLGDRDILTAAALVEATNLVLVALVVFGGLAMIVGAPLPGDLWGVYTALAVTWLLAAGVGSLLALLNGVSESFGRILAVLLRPLFWISGLFYTATELSRPARDLLWWNPLFHATELLREGYFHGYRSPIAELWYPAAFGIVCLLAALCLQARGPLNLSRRPGA